MLLTDEERKKVAKIVNALVDIPLVPEALEETMFEHAVGMIDEAVEDTLPSVFTELLRNGENGINKNHAQDFANRLIESINKKIDLPYLDEEQEQRLLRIIIDPMVKGMVEGRKLDDLLAHLG